MAYSLTTGDQSFPFEKGMTLEEVKQMVDTQYNMQPVTEWEVNKNYGTKEVYSREFKDNLSDDEYIIYIGEPGWYD